jgi:hypothetical protein
VQAGRSELGRCRYGGTQAGIRYLGRKKKGLASSPIIDTFTARDHTQERKIEGEGRKEVEAEQVASALLLTRVIIRSVAGSRRAPPVPVAVTAFESCMLSMRAERGAGLRPPEKGRGVCC